MRALLIFTFCLAGCSNTSSIPDGGKHTDLGSDMAAVVDFSGVDVQSKSNCAGYVACYGECVANDPSTDTDGSVFQSCADTDCKNATKTASYNKFVKAQICSQTYCICGAGGTFDGSTNGCDTADGGAGSFYKCGVDSSGHFTEANGAPIPTGNAANSSPCLICLNDAAADLFSAQCIHQGSADCNPSSCETLSLACANDP